MVEPILISNNTKDVAAQGHNSVLQLSNVHSYVSRYIAAGGLILMGCNSSAAAAQKAFSEVPLALKGSTLIYSTTAITQSVQANSPENAAKWRRIFAHLDFWSSTDDASGQLAAQALKICRDLYRGGLQAPRLTREDDGEVDFVWERDGSYTSISLAHDGNLVAYHQAHDNDRPIRIDEPFSEAVYQGFREAANLA